MAKHTTRSEQVEKQRLKAQKEAILVPLPQIDVHSMSYLGTGTSIASGEVGLVLWT